jgi:hypothetical protein
MNAERAQEPQNADAGTESAAREPSEEELHVLYEQELARVTSADLMLQAAVSLLNLGGRRLGAIGPAESGEGAGGPRDLEQVRDAIDGVRALLGVLERRLPRELGPMRDALSQLQLAYAREAQAGAAEASAPSEGGAAARPQSAAQKGGPGEQEPAPGPGPAEASGRLWVPGR